MRYRLMASYLGASYQAAVGPSDHDVTLFAAPPPPEEHGFSPAPGGIWRKQVRLNDLDGLWESRPIGSYHGEPCLVLDDLGDRLHIVYLGMDEQRAAQLGYWEVDRGVFEVVVPRHDITDLAEERHDFPIALLLSALPRALSAGPPGGAGQGFGQNGTGMAASGAGPGGMTGWNGPAAAPQPARGQLPAGGSAQNPQAQTQQAQSQQVQLPSGQLPAARSQQPAVAGQQFPPAAPYQLPDGPERGAGLPGAPGPAAPAGHVGAQGAGRHGEAQQSASQQLPAGQPAPGGPQFPGMTARPGTPYAPAAQPGAPGAPRAPGGQPPGMGQAQPPAAPQPLPGRPQLPMAQQAPGTQQSPAAQQQQQQPQAAPEPAAPAAVAAWHGSPPPNGNGTWYFQPGPDPQQGGAAAVGYPPNGMPPVNDVPQNGYAQPDQGTVQTGPPGVPPGVQQQQYAQPAPQAPAAYQQAPTGAEQPQAGQPAHPATLSPAAQQAPAAPASQYLPQAPPAQQAPQQAPAVTPARSAMPPVTTAAAPPSTAPAAGSGTVPLSAPWAPSAPAAAAAVPAAAPPSAAPAAADVTRTDPLGALPSAPAAGQQPPVGLAAGAIGKLTGAVRGRRAARKPRLAMSAIFADLVDMADIPRSAYAVDEEVTGAMCLFKTDGGYEVFSCAEDARHEVRFFEEEESAYFYLFGVLAAEALRNGRLTPRRG